MEMHILKYGNLMGSPDMKKAMHDCGDDTAAADRIWDSLYKIKIAFGLDGRSTSVLLTEPDCPELFPALVDASWLCADPSSYGVESLKAPVDSLISNGLKPEQIKSIFITHPHGDHLDSRLSSVFTNAEFLSLAESRIPGTSPLVPEMLPPDMKAINTPGHGTPHCSYIIEIARHNLAVCVAGDLIMSHAHFLSLDHPLSFSDHKAGRDSVETVQSALRASAMKYRMILPGHDIPFFLV